MGRWKLLVALGLVLLPDWHNQSDWQADLPIWQAPALEAVPREPKAYRDWLVEREALRQGADPRVMLAIARVENVSADPLAVSPAGAIGLLQIMPSWRSAAGIVALCGGTDLTDSSTNVCYGVAILRFYLGACEGELNCALARYNGAITPWKAELYIEQVGEALGGM